MRQCNFRRASSLLRLICLATFWAASLMSLVGRQPVHAASNTITITIVGAQQPPGFLPSLMTIHVNETVVFVNQSTPSAAYRVVADDGTFSSPAIAPGTQWSTSFKTPGTHEYRDPLHATAMVGELTVVPMSVQLLPTPNPTTLANTTAKITHPTTHTNNPEAPMPWLLIVVLVLIGVIVVGIILIQLRRKM